MKVEKARLVQLIKEEVERYQNEAFDDFSHLQGDVARRSEWNPGNSVGSLKVRLENIYSHWESGLIDSDEAMNFVEQLLGHGPQTRETPMEPGADIGANTMEQ